VANGIVSAIGMLQARGEQVDRPIVVRLDGNNAAEVSASSKSGDTRGRAGATMDGRPPVRRTGQHGAKGA